MPTYYQKCVEDQKNHPCTAGKYHDSFTTVTAVTALRQRTLNRLLFVGAYNRVLLHHCSYASTGPSRDFTR